MEHKLTYEQLEQRIKELEKENGHLRNNSYEFANDIEKYLDFLTKIPMMCHSIDRNGYIVSVSDFWLNKMGYSKEEVIGHKSLEFLTNESQLLAQEKALPEFFEKGFAENIPYRFVAKDGTVLDVLMSAISLRDSQGEFVSSFAMMTDITQLKQAEHYHHLHSMILNQIEDCVTVTDLDGFITSVNQAECRMLGKSPEDLIGQHVSFFGHDSVHGVSQDEILHKTLQNGSWRGEVVNHSADGSALVLICRTFVVRDDSGQPIALCGISTDTTESKRTLDALQESEEKYKKLINSSPDAIALVDEDGKFLTVNPSMAERFGLKLGLTQEELEDKTFFEVMPHDLAKMRMKKAREALEKNKTMYFEDERDGKYFQNYYVPISPHHPKRSFQVISRDITKQREIETRYQEITLYDSLTQLYNRAFFEEEIRRLSDGRNCPIGIIVCDIDGLKLINNTMGHRMGNRVLRASADILKNCFRESDIVARIGGDEFAVLLPQSNEDVVFTCRNRIREEVAQYNELSSEISLSISIGYAVEYKKPVDMNELFNKATDIMNREKLHQNYSSRSEIVQTLIKTMEARDYITGGHAERLQGYVHHLGRDLGLSDDKLNDLYLLARFHDLGKVGIPDSILFKPGPLTKEEFQEMQKHCEIGHRIALSITDLSPIADLILKHHEWWNGKGYPLGLQAENIPLECRILSIVDAYDAITSERPYKKAMSHEEALEELQRCAGTQFDPNLVDKFIELLEQNKDT
jgi:diguanylate cyclase (GGDEF)-like protein/PAS domain S-box-containing protein